jgi:hypothetical protein
MSNFWIAFLFAIGSSAWLYTKFQKYSGNNTRQSAVATVFSGLVIFGIVLSILSTIIK